MTDTYNAGAVYDMAAHEMNRPPLDASPTEQWAWAWPKLMVDHGESIKLADGKRAVPALVSWVEDTALKTETFVIDFRGAFADGEKMVAVGKVVGGVLSCPAPKLEKLSPTLISFTYSHYALSDDIPWHGPLADPAYDHVGHPTSLKLGKSVTGDVVHWDLSKVPHGVAGGTTGSGKTTLMKLIIGQALAYGMQVVFMSPTEDDSTVDAFRGIDNFADICGIEPDTLWQMAKVFQGLKMQVHPTRTKEVAANKGKLRAAKNYSDCDTWGVDIPGIEWDGNRILVVMDEVDGLMGVKADDDSPEFALQQGVLWLVTQGRKSGLHFFSGSQSLYVKTFGPNPTGGRTRANMGFRTGLWQTNKTTAEFIAGEGARQAEDLEAGYSCRGRGVSIGGYAPDGKMMPPVEYQVYNLTDEILHHELRKLRGGDDAPPDPLDDVIALGDLTVPLPDDVVVLGDPTIEPIEVRTLDPGTEDAIAGNLHDMTKTVRTPAEIADSLTHAYDPVTAGESVPRPRPTLAQTPRERQADHWSLIATATLPLLFVGWAGYTSGQAWMMVLSAVGTLAAVAVAVLGGRTI